MTNRKLKPGKIAKNLFLLDLGRANMETLSRLIITLIRREGVSCAKMRELLAIYENEYIPRFEQLSADDAQNVTVKRELSRLGLDFAELEVFIFPQFSESMQTVLRENAGIFLSMLGDNGFGRKRLRRLIAGAAEYEGSATEEAGKLLGFEFGDILPDVTLYQRRDRALSRSQINEFRCGMDAFRKIQEGGIKPDESGT